MRFKIAILLSTVITVILIIAAFFLEYPLPLLITAVLLWPLWFSIVIMYKLKSNKPINLLELQTYSNIARIRQNSERIK